MLLKQIILLLLTFLFTTLSMVNTVRNSFETETQAAIHVSAEEVREETLPTATTPEIVLLSQTVDEVEPASTEEVMTLATIPTEEITTADTIPTEEIMTEDTIPTETEFVYVEKFPEVPHYIQHDYSDIAYGNFGTVGDHGCGVTCVAMVFSYLLDEEILPDYLAGKYGHFNTEDGSDWALFTQSAKDYGISVKKVHHPWEEVVAALQNGQVVIANPRSESIFTTGGHFIVLYGITEDGKILVHDPSHYNYSENNSPILKDGFANGFDQKYLRYSSVPWWIYEAKDIDSLAAKAEYEALNQP